jgi:hypothetical protein
MRTDEGIEVPVYHKGYMAELAALPEDCACNFFTRLIAKKERTMDTRVKDALVTLFGDEAKANEFILTVDETNRAIADGGLLTRETTTEQTETITTEQATETPPETATTPGEQVEPSPLDVVLNSMGEKVASLERTMTEALASVGESVIQAQRAMNDRLSAIETSVAEQQQAVDALKLTDAEKQRTWLADRPANSATQPVTYRPRTDRRSEQEGAKPSLADIAAGTLSKMPK